MEDEGYVRGQNGNFGGIRVLRFSGYIVSSVVREMRVVSVAVRVWGIVRKHLAKLS